MRLDNGKYASSYEDKGKHIQRLACGQTAYRQWYRAVSLLEKPTNYAGTDFDYARYLLYHDMLPPHLYIQTNGKGLRLTSVGCLLFSVHAYPH